MEKPTPTSTSAPQKKTTIADLSPDAFYKILICLPIPDLRSSRLVSRYWNNTIVGIAETFKLLNANKAKVCMHRLDSPGDVMVLKINSEHDFSVETYVAALPYVNPVLPVDSPLILGSVHDRVLLGNVQHSTLFIVNPERRTCLEIEDQTPHGELYGLIYSNDKNNYYIVKVVQWEQPPDDDVFETLAFIYSLRRGRWRTKKLWNCNDLTLSKSVGTLNGKLYFWGSKNIVIFNHSLEEFRLLPVPVELRDKDLQFGVARERLRQGQVMDVLLLSYYDTDTSMASLWRLRRINDVDTFEFLAVWEGVPGGILEDLKPISYLGGEPNKIILFVNYCSIQVYNLVDQSRTEIFHDGEGHWSQQCGFMLAIGFYNSFVPADVWENVVTIKTSRTKRNTKDQPKQGAHALKKLKKD